MARQFLPTCRLMVARLIAWLIFRGPITVGSGRARFAFDPKTGRLLPVIAGAEGDPDPDPDPNPDPDPDPDPDRKTNWKSQARKHERRAKAAKDRADALQAEINELKQGQQSDQEKALATARDEARAEATKEFEEQRRADRLELAVTRQATKGVKLEVEEDGETVEKTVAFADPDDAQVHLERSIARGDIDGDDIFDDDGKVQEEALNTALAELLEEKPHLAAKDGGGAGGGKGRGSADAGRGRPPKDGAGSVEDELKKIQKRT